MRYYSTCKKCEVFIFYVQNSFVYTNRENCLFPSGNPLCLFTQKIEKNDYISISLCQSLLVIFSNGETNVCLFKLQHIAFLFNGKVS